MQKGKSLLAKIVMLCLVVTCCFALVLGATSCGKEAKDPTFAINDNGHLIVTTYDAKGEVKETKDLGAVTGLKGDKGDKGDQGEQGPKGEKGEDGKLEHGHEDVASEDYELQEANCQQDGKTIRVFADGCAELLTTEGGHDFSLAAIEAGEMPANLRVTALVPDEGHESAYEMDDEGHESLNGTARATIKCLVCGEETEVEISLADDYTVDAVDPTHTEKGYRKAFVTYTADGVKYEHQLIEYDVFDEVGDHFFNGNAINAGLTYTLDQIKEIFGEDYTTFTNKEIGCGEDGYAYFVCEECGKNVLLYVRNDHKWSEPEVLGYNDEDGVLLKFVCKECRDVLENYADESKYVESNCAAAAHVDWTYELDDVPYTGTYNIPGAEKNLDAHRYVNAEGESTVLLVNREYRISDLDAIFDEGDYEISGNNMNCSDTYGNAIFRCADCKKPIVLENVLDNHKLAIDKEDEEYHVGADGVKLVFKCENCGEGRKVISAVDYKSVKVYSDTDIDTVYAVDKNGKITIDEKQVVSGVDCQHGTKDYLVYTYREQADNTLKVEKFELDSDSASSTVHKLAGKQLDENAVYAYATLEAMFGEELDGLEISGNAIDCKPDSKPGKAIFTCDVCGKTIIIDIRGNHTFKLDEEYKVTYTRDNDTYEFAGLTTEDTTGVTGILKLHCTVCGETFDTVDYTVTKDRKFATCQAKGYYKVTYTYTFDGEHTVELLSEVLPLNTAGHTFGDKMFDENHIYGLAEIKAIFGEGNYVVSGNEVTCKDEKTGKVIVKCDTCNKTIVLDFTGDHNYKLVESEFYWEGKNEGVEPDKGTLVSAYLTFECQVCDEDDEDHFAKFVFKGDKALVAKKLAQSNKEDGKIYVEYTYKLNGVEYTEEKVLKVIPKDPSLHVYTDKEGNVHTFSDDEEYDIEELREIFGDDLVEFDNDEYHAAFICEDEDCELVLINVLPEDRV